MSTLVTGLEGFVGQHLLDALSPNDYPVFGTAIEPPPSLAREKVHYRNVDITDAKALDEYVKECAPERIIHLAAVSNVGLSLRQPELTFRVNVQGTLNLLEAARRHCSGAAILLASSGEVHGNSRPGSAHGFLETDPTAPPSPYAQSKLQMENEALAFARPNGMDVRIARAYNHTGPGQHERFLFSHTAKALAQIEKHDDPPIIKLGNLNVQRDFLDVRDVVRAYGDILDKGKPLEVYNVSSGRSASLRELVELMIQVSGIPAEIELEESRLRPNEINELRGNSQKLQSATGWRPQRSLRNTFGEMIADWKGRLSASARPS